MKFESFKSSCWVSRSLWQMFRISVLHMRTGNGEAGLSRRDRDQSQLAIPADWTSSAGNTPYFNREHLEQIKTTSERFRSEFPYKNSDY